LGGIMRSLFFLAAPLLVALTGCSSVPPPASPITRAADALDRLRISGECGHGVQATAKIDYFGEKGRGRGDLLMFAVAPASLRMDIVSPFGVALATLASDGQRFSLADLREKRFLVGEATACNIARFTQVPIPAHALVALLRGQAPILKHDDAQATVSWSSKGYYVVTLPSTRDAIEELHIEPHPDDRRKPWSEQRMRLREVTVRQNGALLYRAELDAHAGAETAKTRIDPDGIDPPIPPSGPQCNAEIPRKIHVEVPDKNEDVLFRYDKVVWNPPLPAGTFTLTPPPGMSSAEVRCE
jgi:hypothetical protein